MNNIILISIFSVTSVKGFAICNTLLGLNNKKYIIKGFTNNIKSKKSKLLIEKGVQIVELKDTSLTTLSFINNHLNKCNVVIFITDELTSFENEYEFGINIVDSCISSNVSQLIYNTCLSTSLISDGKITINSFDNKYKIEQYIKSKSNQIKFISFIYIPFFYQNFINTFPPFKINFNDFTYNSHTLNYNNYISNDNDNIVNILNSISKDKFTTNSTFFNNNINNKIFNNEFCSIPLPIQNNKSIYLCDKDEIGYLINEIINKPFDFNSKSILFQGSLMNGKEISISLTKKFGINIQHYYIPFELLNYFIKPKCLPNNELSKIFNFINEYNIKIQEYFENSDILKLYNFKPSTFNEYLDKKNNKIKIKSINLKE